MTIQKTRRAQVKSMELFSDQTHASLNGRTTCVAWEFRFLKVAAVIWRKRRVGIIDFWSGLMLKKKAMVMLEHI